jgi:predicted nucleic acid-binding protein
VDASVVAKWVLPVEPHQEGAFKLKSDHVSGRVELCAPTIMTAEVTNALWKSVRFGKFPEEKAQQALESLCDVDIALFDLDWTHALQSFGIACELDLAVYDATYLYLAEKLKACLLTADNKLYEKAKGRFAVRHVKDY